MTHERYMTDQQYMAVYNLWHERTLTGQYLSDVQPYNLTPSEYTSLIIDSFYSDAKPQIPISPFHFKRMGKSMVGLGIHNISAIKMHLDALK